MRGRANNPALPHSMCRHAPTAVPVVPVQPGDWHGRVRHQRRSVADERGAAHQRRGRRPGHDGLRTGHRAAGALGPGVDGWLAAQACPAVRHGRLCRRQPGLRCGRKPAVAAGRTCTDGTGRDVHSRGRRHCGGAGAAASAWASTVTGVPGHEPELRGGFAAGVVAGAAIRLAMARVAGGCVRPAELRCAGLPVPRQYRRARRQLQRPACRCCATRPWAGRWR